MLVNLRTTHKPKTLREAIELLRRPGVYPVYGGGAWLIRADKRDAQEAADLSGVVASTGEVVGDDLSLGAAATLETVAASDPALGAIIRAETPLTLRNALTMGDLLMEVRPDSLLLTALYGLAARVDTPERGQDDIIEIGRWYAMTPDERRQNVIQSVIVPNYPGTLWRFAYEKVSRTPADSPIVAAFGFAYAGQPDPGEYVVVCGLDSRPLRYTPGMASRLNDYKGSAEYRAEMAEALSEQALARARELARML